MFTSTPFTPLADLRRSWRKRVGLPAFQKVKDTDQFNAAATSLLRESEESLEPMKQYFDVFEVITNDDSLKIVLAPHLGFYQLEVDDVETCLYFRSPVSGRHTYELNAYDSQWVCPDDGHHFEGKLVQDLTSQCNGIARRNTRE